MIYIWSSVPSFRKVQLVCVVKMLHSSRQQSQAGWTQPSQIHQESILMTAQVVASIMTWQGNFCVQSNMIGMMMSVFCFSFGWLLTRMYSEVFTRSFVTFRQNTITLVTFSSAVSTPTSKEMQGSQKRGFWKVYFSSRWVVQLLTLGNSFSFWC